MHSFEGKFLKILSNASASIDAEANTRSLLDAIIDRSAGGASSLGFGLAECPSSNELTDALTVVCQQLLSGQKASSSRLGETLKAKIGEFTV